MENSITRCPAILTSPGLEGKKCKMFSHKKYHPYCGVHKVQSMLKLNQLPVAASTNIVPFDFGFKEQINEEKVLSNPDFSDYHYVYKITFQTYLRQLPSYNNHDINNQIKYVNFFMNYKKELIKKLEENKSKYVMYISYLENELHEAQIKKTNLESTQMENMVKLSIAKSLTDLSFSAYRKSVRSSVFSDAYSPTVANFDVKSFIDSQSAEKQKESKEHKEENNIPNGYRLGSSVSEQNNSKRRKLDNESYHTVRSITDDEEGEITDDE